MLTDCNFIETPGSKAGGIYLFCFARSHCLTYPDIACLDDRQPISQWEYNDIVAVLGRLSVEDFCGPEAENRMKDLVWIGPRACRHEEVVDNQKP